MISLSFRKKFKKDLGENFCYTPEVRKLLDANNITNRKGNPYSAQSIRNVFLGNEENTAIEIAILQCYKNALAQKQRYEALKKEMESST